MNKKLAGIFAMCALLLTGCQGAKESSKEITPPDTGWGKTVDEVLADWNLDRDQVEIFSETNSAAAIAVDTEATSWASSYRLPPYTLAVSVMMLHLHSI